MTNVLEKSKLILQSLNIDIDREKEIKLNLIYDIELEALLNYINDENLPKGLAYTLASRVAGKFLLNNLILGKYEEVNNLSVDDLMQVVSIKEYETTIQYNKNEDAITKKDNLIKALNKMIEYNYEEINRFRRIRWT